ncbi:MAG: prolipoprotein diacylglyceryl transferase [Isosphaeraceae bacterium]
MKQVLFRIPLLNIPVYGFGLLVVIAFYVALALAISRSRRERLDPSVVFDLAVVMLLGGMVGARLFYVIEYWGERVNTLGQVFKVWEGGIVFYGGAFGGFLALFLYRLIRPFPLLPTLDAVSPGVALGAGIGRIGCFLNGCCHGGVCSIPGLGVRFPRGSPPWLAERARELIPADALWTLPLHPTQLYSALDGLLLFLVLSAFYPLRRRDGEVFALLLLGYAVTRFVSELLRDDEAALASGLTIAQTISVLLFLSGVAFWSKLAEQPPHRYADEAPAPAE